MKLKKPEVLPDFVSELTSGFLLGKLIIGVDEVGRGCLAGPVVAAAAVLPLNALPPGFDPKSGERISPLLENDFFLSKIKDSKLIPEKDRAGLAAATEAYVEAFSVQEASVEEIGKLNILYASHLAMERAVLEVEKKLSRKADLVLVDGNMIPKNLKDRGRAIIKGDQKCLSIACASIIAKVYRDVLMEKLDEAYPGYGHKKHKGYPTPFHKAQIQSLGVTPIHRLGFKGVS